MNIKNKSLLLAAGFLLAASTLFVSCTNESLTEAPAGPDEPDNDNSRKIGRASCRERV